MNTFQCDISIVTLLSEDTLYIDILPDSEFELKDFHQLMDAAFQIGQGKKFYNLINVGEYTTPNHEARVASTSEEGSIYKLADAFVIHSTPQKFISNFYMSFHKPAVPTRFFTSIEAATEWLDEIKKENSEKLA